MQGVYKLIPLKTGLFNIFLRGMTLLSKFIFILFIGRYSFDETNLGVFGLLSTTIALLIYILGFDFYVFNTREILNNQDQIHLKIEGQVVFHLMVYSVVLPLGLWGIFFYQFLPHKFLLVLLTLVISEHLGQELYRLYTALEKPWVANFMLFIRSGLWVWIVLVDFFLLQNPVNLPAYLWIWAFLSWCSVLIFGFILVREIGPKGFRFKRPDFHFIGRGFRTSAVFFAGSVAFQVIQFSDRYMIDFFHGKKLLGVYTAYAQFSNAVDVFTFSAVSMIFFPRMLRVSTNTLDYEKVKTLYQRRSIMVSLILIIMVTLFAPFFLGVMDKNLFLQEIRVLHILLIGVFILTISHVYHYDLYVKKKDRIILMSAVLAMIVNVLLNILLIPKFELMGAACATLIAFTVLFGIKAIISYKIKSNGNN